MSVISRKLKSSSGASIIIALVFMLFCTFVGGSVLAAASANGYRVKSLSEQQIYLNQRSAALLAADELTPAAGNLTLHIYDNKIQKQKITVEDGGVVKPEGEAMLARTIKFSLPTGTKLNELQRIMVEMTVLRYLEGISGASVSLDNFVYLEPDGTETELTGTGDFWYQTFEGSAQLSTAKTDGTALTDFDMFYRSADGERLYDFLVDFGTDSRLKAAVNAFYSEGEPITVTRIGKANIGGIEVDARITTESTMSVIAWQQPVVEKGGAA